MGGRSWTHKELKVLRQCARMNLSTALIMQRIPGRTEDSIKMMLSRKKWYKSGHSNPSFPSQDGKLVHRMQTSIIIWRIRMREASFRRRPQSRNSAIV